MVCFLKVVVAFVAEVMMNTKVAQISLIIHPGESCRIYLNAIELVINEFGVYGGVVCETKQLESYLGQYLPGLGNTSIT